MSYAIWFSGLSGAGKTSIAGALAGKLRAHNIPVVVLDGDEVRKTLSSDLGYTLKERDTHIRRIAQLCKLIVKNGIIVIASVISPKKEIREEARASIGKEKFIEVFIDCPLEICKERDPQGHYKKVQDKQITEFVGITIPYEAPEHPDVHCPTHQLSKQECVERIWDELKKRGAL